MEIYIELTYMINAFIYIIVFEILSILLNVKWSFKKILLYSFLCNISLILIYIDYLPYISLIYWLILFVLLFKKQFFLYFPAYLVVYFSVLLFINTLIQSSFIYNGILITPTHYTDIAVICVSVLFVIIEYMYLVFIKKKIGNDQYLYSVCFFYKKKQYRCLGFLDSGNEAFYKGYPLIFLKKGIISDYQKIDTLMIDSISYREIDIICVERFQVNGQTLNNVYIGIIDNVKYDCLLNKELMGGVL